MSLDSHTEEVTEPGARRPRTINVLDDFRIDYGTCMYCSICVEVCPFDALHWEAAPDLSAAARTYLVHNEQRLAAHVDDQR
jgi:NADH-quinone oxidoreductase subunit I